MMVKKYKASVFDMQNPVDSIYTVTFKSDREFKFRPGQFLHLALDVYEPSGQWPESRCFSMQSPPNQNQLTITYSAVGRFTRRMAQELKIGTEVWLKMPFGDIFERGHSKENCVFIAGGTGVTPFLSLFNSVDFADYNLPRIYLGFRNRQYNLYQQYLQEINNQSYTLSIKYQEKDGLLDIDSIFNENGSDATYFISGPPIMIRAFKSFLMERGIIEENIITDDWE